MYIIIIIFVFFEIKQLYGTEQNLGDPWRKETAVKFYISIPTLFTGQQSFSSARRDVYRSDDMIWLIELIFTCLFSLHPRINTLWHKKSTLFHIQPKVFKKLGISF